MRVQGLRNVDYPQKRPVVCQAWSLGCKLQLEYWKTTHVPKRSSGRGRHKNYGEASKAGKLDTRQLRSTQLST